MPAMRSEHPWSRSRIPMVRSYPSLSNVRAPSDPIIVSGAGETNTARYSAVSVLVSVKVTAASYVVEKHPVSVLRNASNNSTATPKTSVTETRPPLRAQRLPRPSMRSSTSSASPTHAPRHLFSARAITGTRLRASAASSRGRE